MATAKQLLSSRLKSFRDNLSESFNQSFNPVRVASDFNRQVIQPTRQVVQPALQRVVDQSIPNLKASFVPTSPEFQRANQQFSTIARQAPEGSIRGTLAQGIEGVRGLGGMGTLFREPVANTPTTALGKTARLTGAALPGLVFGYGTGSTLPGTLGGLGIQGALGAGIGKLIGADPIETASKSLSAYGPIRMVSKVTNPLIGNITNKAVSGLSPLAQGIASRGIAGALSIPEGILMNKSIGIKGYTPAEAAIDFTLGATTGGAPSARAVAKTAKTTGVFDLPEFKSLEKKIPNLTEIILRSDKEDVKRMTDLIDLVRNKRVNGVKIKPESPQAIAIETEARRMAEAMGLNPDVPNGNLSRVFDRILQYKNQVVKQTFNKSMYNDMTAGIVGNKPTKQLDEIISKGRSQIGSIDNQVKVPIKEQVSKAAKNFYTQWVDRYTPIVEAANTAKRALKAKGAELRPEFDPVYLVRRLTGAGGIADSRFKTELDPIIKQLDGLNISKQDFDVYLANKRIAGFGKAGRDIYGADPKQANEIINALETKYGADIARVADELYQYQDRGLNEMIEAGFISAKDAEVVKSQNPDYSPLYRVMDDVSDYLGVPTKRAMQGAQPIKKIKGSERQIQSPLESIIGNTYTQRAAIEKNRVAKAIVGLQDIVDMGFKKVGNEGYNTITVKGADGLAENRKVLKPEYLQADDVIFIWNDGKKEAWKVGKEIADVAKATNEESMNLVLKLLQAPASLLRQGATGRNPAFIIPNIIRDQLDAGITSKYGYIPFVDYVSGLVSMMRNDNIYQSWANSGAKIDLGEMSGKKSIANYVSGATQKRRLRDWLTAGLDTLGKYSEQPTRVGLYKKAFKKTNNELLAMLESRDATVDFARMGSKMSVANSIIPFLNVSVQGFDKLVRAVKNNPMKVATLMGVYAVAPQVTTTLYNLTHFPDQYGQIPDYVKEDNFVLITGTNADGTIKMITIPKGNVVPIASNPVQNFLEYAYGQDSESIGQLATNILTGVLPVAGQGSTGKEVLTKTLGQVLPQGIKPLAEAALNRSFYKFDPERQESKEIVPFYLKDKPAYQQDYEFTPQMYKKIGALLNISPLMVKNTMEGYLAGYSKLPAQAIEIMYKLGNGERISPNEIPIAYRFYQETYNTKGSKPEEKRKVPGLFERLGLTKEAGAGTADIQALPTDIEDLKPLYKEDLSTMKNYRDKKNKILYDQTLDEAERKEKLTKLQGEMDQAMARVSQIEGQNPELPYRLGLDTYGKGSSFNVEERASFANEWILKAKDEEQKQAWIDEMWDSGVLTTGKSGTAEFLRLNYGINPYTGKGKSKGATSKKKAKIAVPKVPTRPTMKAVKIVPKALTNIKGVKLSDVSGKAPKVRLSPADLEALRNPKTSTRNRQFIKVSPEIARLMRSV